MLDSADEWMTGLASYRGRCAVPATAGGNGVFYLLVAAAVAGLAIGEVEGVNVGKGVAEMRGVGAEVAGEGAIRRCAEQIMAAVDIMGSDRGMASGAGVGIAETQVSCRVVDGAAHHRSHRRVSIGMAGIALLHIMETGQQAALGVTLGGCAARSGGDKDGMVDIMNDWFRLVGMAVKAAGRVGGSGDDIGNSGAGWEIGVDVAGRLVAGSAGAGAVGGDIVQHLDVIHIV